MCSSTARAANRLISDPYESQIQRHHQQSMPHNEPNIKPQMERDANQIMAQYGAIYPSTNRQLYICQKQTLLYNEKI